MNDEVWKPIPEFDGYEASSWGRVRSLDRIDRGGRRRKGVILKPFKNEEGYYTIKLAGQGMFVHQAVMWAFVGPTPPEHEVNHINGDKGCNEPGNLEYVTRSQNMQHGFAVLGWNRKGEANARARLTEAQVQAIRQEYTPGYGNLARIARKYPQVTPRTIGHIVNGVTWSHI
jgi:hypothetical protein